MSYAQASLIQDIRNLVEDNPWETTSTTTGTTSPVAVPDGTKWAAGDVGEWSFSGTAGGEQFLVQSVSVNNLTVVRGYNGTTAESHSSGDRVVKNPRYSVLQIKEAVDKVVDAMYPTVWKIVSANITPNTTSIWFDSGLTGADATGMIDLVAADQLYGSSNQYVGTFGSTRPGVKSRPILYERNMPTSLVTSGIGLQFPARFHHASNSVAVKYRVKLTSTVSASNYVDFDEGLLTEALVYGVIARLLGAKEIGNVSEDSRLGETAVGSFVQSAGWFELKHRELLGQYHDDLMNRVPPMPDQHYVPGWW